MCGIVGIVGERPAAPLLLEALRRLEYRGYDSAGVATLVNAVPLTLGVLHQAGAALVLAAATALLWTTRRV